MRPIRQAIVAMDTNTGHRILLIGRDAADAETIRAALAETQGRTFSVEWVRHLSAGVARLKTGQIDAVLLDLFLPDGQGLETFEHLWQAAPEVPILIVCNPRDESLAMQAVERHRRCCDGARRRVPDGRWSAWCPRIQPISGLRLDALKGCNSGGPGENEPSYP